MVEWKKLGDICEKTNNIKWRLEPVDKVYTYIDLSSVSIETHKIENSIKICKEDAPSRAQQIVNDGDILLGTTRPTLKRYCQISKQYDNQICSTGFCVFRANKDIVNNRWLLHNISDNRFWDYCDKKQQGAGYPSLSNTDAFAYLIPVPSLSEQKRIVGILDTFTASIDNLKEQIAQRRKQYEYYRCGLFSTKKWNDVKIGELTKVFSCPRVFKDQWQDSGIPFWRSSDIMSYHNGVVNPRGEVFISQSLYEELSSKSDRIKEGDILVTGGGSIGIPYLKGDNSPLFVKDADLICIQKCSSIEPKYLYHYFLSTDFKLYLKKITHDATIAHYTINQIKDTPIPLPPLSEQQRIVDILDKFEASIQNLEAQLSQREKQYEYYRNKLLTFE